MFGPCALLGDTMRVVRADWLLWILVMTALAVSGEAMSIFDCEGVSGGG